MDDDLARWEDYGGYVFPYATYQDAWDSGDPVGVRAVLRISNAILRDLAAENR